MRPCVRGCRRWEWRAERAPKEPPLLKQLLQPQVAQRVARQTRLRPLLRTELAAQLVQRHMAFPPRRGAALRAQLRGAAAAGSTAALVAAVQAANVLLKAAPEELRLRMQLQDKCIQLLKARPLPTL